VSARTATILDVRNVERIAEIHRRRAEYDSGSVQAVPWEQVRADALRRARPTGVENGLQGKVNPTGGRGA